MKRPANLYRRMLQRCLPYLASRYHVASVGLFGSHVRGTQTADSDLDVLVTFEEMPSLLQFIELENYLKSDEIQRHADLVMKFNWFGGYYQDPKNLLPEFAVDIVSTSDSPSVSASRQPMPKSRMNTERSGAIMMFDGFNKPWNSPC